MFTDYTIVCGVDRKHLNQLRWVYPTWIKSKPSLLRQPLLLFYDKDQWGNTEVFESTNHPNVTAVPWPLGRVTYEGDESSKWYNPQRYKMLAGFVHVPASHVKTTYWLKLDTDTVAIGQDGWIDENWFKSNPAIVSQPWGFTKPPNQMLLLDKWAEKNPILNKHLKLDLVPEPDSDKVKHKRIISWCGFFQTAFTRTCSQLCQSEGVGQLPVPSQDGYMWYVAKRMGKEILRVQMKSLGWEHWGTEWNIRESVRKVLE